MAGRQGFIPVVHAATESRPDQIELGWRRTP